MNCRQIDKYIYDYCDNLLTPDQKILFEQHLAQCHNCRQAVDQALLETSILREEWDTPDLPADFTSQVMERIVAVPISSTSPVTATNGKLPWLRWFMGIAATAAILLMVLYVPGIIKNGNFVINVADREKTATVPADEKVKSPAAKQNEDFLVGGKEEASEKMAKTYLDEPESEPFDSSVVVPTPQNESILYGAQSDAVSEEILTTSLDQNQEKARIAADVLSVQPANLPPSYTMLDKFDGNSCCTYIFGTGNKEDRLTINIAQLPLHQPGKSSYSRSNIRASNTNDKTATTPNEPAGGNETEKAASVEQVEDFEVLVNELPETHTISYEVEHNQQVYLLTITANLSPQELVTLSQTLQLQSPTP